MSDNSSSPVIKAEVLGINASVVLPSEEFEVLAHRYADTISAEDLRHIADSIVGNVRVRLEQDSNFSP